MADCWRILEIMGDYGRLWKIMGERLLENMDFCEDFVKLWKIIEYGRIRNIMIGQTAWRRKVG